MLLQRDLMYPPNRTCRPVSSDGAKTLRNKCWSPAVLWDLFQIDVYWLTSQLYLRSTLNHRTGSCCCYCDP